MQIELDKEGHLLGIGDKQTMQIVRKIENSGIPEARHLTSLAETA